MITNPVAGSVVVAVDGIAIDGAAVAIDAETGMLSLEAVPMGGAVVTAGFLFDVPVRFDIDRLDIELTSFDAAEAPNIPLIEVFE